MMKTIIKSLYNIHLNPGILGPFYLTNPTQLEKNH